jgi:primosomal protein N' (replication factor Y)
VNEKAQAPSHSDPSYVRVVPEVSLDKAFDYRVPEALRDRVRPGTRVRAPFGGRIITGYVIALVETPEVARVRDIEEVVGDRPFLPETLISLAHWLAEYYCAPLAAAFRCVLPEAVRRADARFKQQLWVEPRPGIDPEQAAKLLGKAKAQGLAWERVLSEGGNWLAELCVETRTTAAVWRALEDKGLVSIQASTKERDPFEGQEVVSHDPLALNDEQAAALAVVREQMDGLLPRVILLHGVTGSGKTEVYLQAIAECVHRGKTALVLVPEISLTPQTVDRFRARFLGQKIRIAVLHSHLSQGERHDQWQQIHSGRARIVIGARSAVFAPLHDLGLIIVDEEHEGSYKQEEAPPYHARDVAVMRGHLEKIPVVLGSATPSLESFHHAREGKYVLARLTRRVDEGRLPTVHLLDLRQEFKKEKRAMLLAPRLVEAVRARLAAGQQTILFLNRRGYSTSLQCPQCGQVQECPNCSLPLTYHRQAGRLRCHLCDHAAPVPRECPECHFGDYKHSGMGTEKIEQAVGEAFPDAAILRMDSDTMKGKDAYRRALRDFAEGRVDILVGTQMIAKGLHFPNVTCVGVVQADLALQLPDFRAAERVFQVLMQVGGRAGRGEVAGEVFVQTRTPFHPAIQFARHHDYEGFAEQELEFRRSLNYPPFQRAVLITFQGVNEEKTLYVAEQAARQLRPLAGNLAEMSGPAPAPIPKINNRHRFHLFLKTSRMTALMRALRPGLLGGKWPEGVKMTVDVDPVYLL